jgi:hypothetical protein
MPPFCSDCAGAIRTRLDISVPDSRRSPVAGRGPEAAVEKDSAPLRHESVLSAPARDCAPQAAMKPGSLRAR